MEAAEIFSGGKLCNILLSKKMRVIEMRKAVIASIILAGISFNPVMGAQMAIWDFGPNAAGYTSNPTTENVNGTPTLVLSGGTLDTGGKNGVDYTDIAGVTHIAGQAGAWDDVKVTGPDAEWDVTIKQKSLLFSSEESIALVGQSKCHF
jgi:hypothetical protein